MKTYFFTNSLSLLLGFLILLIRFFSFFFSWHMKITVYVYGLQVSMSDGLYNGMHYAM